MTFIKSFEVIKRIESTAIAFISLQIDRTICRTLYDFWVSSFYFSYFKIWVGACLFNVFIASDSRVIFLNEHNLICIPAPFPENSSARIGQRGGNGAVVLCVNFLRDYSPFYQQIDLHKNRISAFRVFLDAYQDPKRQRKVWNLLWK